LFLSRIFFWASSPSFYRSSRFTAVTNSATVHGEGPVQLLLALEDRGTGGQADAKRRRVYLSVLHLKAKEHYTTIRAEQATCAVSRFDAWRAHVAQESPQFPVNGSSSCSLIFGDCNSDRRLAEPCLGILAGDTRSMAPAMDWTTFKYRKDGCSKRQIDFVFHSRTIRPQRYLAEPDPDAQAFVFASTGLPNARYGSDHIAVAYQMHYCPEATGQKRRATKTQETVASTSIIPSAIAELPRRRLVAWAKRSGRAHGVRGNSSSVDIRQAMLASGAGSAIDAAAPVADKSWKRKRLE